MCRMYDAHLCGCEVSVQERHCQEERFLVQTKVHPDLNQPTHGRRAHGDVQILIRLKGWAVLVVEILGGRPTAGLRLVEVAAERIQRPTVTTSKSLIST